MICNFLEKVVDFQLCDNFLVVPPGFEPGSPGPKPEMMDHYTTGLRAALDGLALLFDGTRSRQYQAAFTLP